MIPEFLHYKHLSKITYVIIILFRFQQKRFYQHPQHPQHNMQQQQQQHKQQKHDSHHQMSQGNIGFSSNHGSSSATLHYTSNNQPNSRY